MMNRGSDSNWVRTHFFPAISLMIAVSGFSQNNTSANTNPVGILGAGNIAIGVDVMTASEISSYQNIGVGYRALRQLRSGHSNTAVGSFAMEDNTGGFGNTAFGNRSLGKKPSSSYNTVFGYGAFMISGNPAGGSDNTGFGTYALYLLSTGVSNTAVGRASLSAVQTGYANDAVGNFALFGQVSGYFNVAMGSDALRNNSANNNVAIGVRALQMSFFNQDNVALGYESMLNQSVGPRNTAIGYRSGANTLGTGSIYLGYKAGVGNTRDHRMFIANDSVNTIMYANGATRQVLLGVANPTQYEFAGTRSLNIHGGILTDSIRIGSVSGWPDFVFHDDYELMDLDQLEDFIRAHRRLPDMYSQCEVKRDGIELGDIQKGLVKKIEELVLYTIHLAETGRQIRERVVLLSDQQKKADEQIAALKESILQLKANH